MSNFQGQFGPKEINISPRTLAALIGGAVLIFIIVVGFSQATTVVEPGNRGVHITLGKVSPIVLDEGLKFKMPFISRVEQVSVRQQTSEMETECYSFDLQQVSTRLRVLYRIPDHAVVSIYKDYEGDEFASLVAPRVVEALKEVASTKSAEMIVQTRDEIKLLTLQGARSKIGEIPNIGPLIIIEDITLSDLSLSAELNAAIEQKMTQREEAERAKFIQRQAEIEAETVVIKAKGDAESIEIRGKALRESPAFLKLQILEKWDGVSPLVVGGPEGGNNANVLVPLNDLR